MLADPSSGHSQEPATEVAHPNSAEFPPRRREKSLADQRDDERAESTGGGSL